MRYYSEQEEYDFVKADGNAGYDLRTKKEFTILPKQRVPVYTGLYLEIPEGVVGLIWPRSGLSAKHGIDVLAGVIDSSYRGEIIVCLLNTGDDAIKFNAGDRIAQILFQEHKTYDNIRVGSLEDLTKTDRNEKGFGSSGNG